MPGGARALRARAVGAAGGRAAPLVRGARSGARAPRPHAAASAPSKSRCSPGAASATCTASDRAHRRWPRAILWSIRGRRWPAHRSARRRDAGRRVARRGARLVGDGGPGDAPAWNATGYDALRACRGRRTVRWSEAREPIVIATRQYAKRQRTWFRHQLADEHVTRLDPARLTRSSARVAWWSGEEAKR